MFLGCAQHGLHVGPEDGCDGADRRAARADGDMTASEAADLKTKLASATLPGYKGGGGLGFGH